MKLLRFRVTDFRSVEDSGWIDLDKVTALIGVNESGKTNLLLPLWKLNPAYEGQIRPNADYPKQNFGEIRSAPDKYCFITADFSVAYHRRAASALWDGLVARSGSSICGSHSLA
jgi:ABC-type polar amino acid transport system ATPase subunit